MQESGTENPLRALDLEARGVTVRYQSGKNQESTFQPETFRVGLEGFYIPWAGSPTKLKEATVEWEGNPFMSETFAASCRVEKRESTGLQLGFSSPPPSAYTNWLNSISATLWRKTPNASIRTSQLYTLATVVSAFGLFCGAMAILLPIVVGDLNWVDPVAKACLVIMVLSIGAFAVIRALAGKQEVKAISQGQV